MPSTQKSTITVTAVAQVPFVTVAFGLWIDKKTDVPTVERMIHIGIPYIMERFFRETGRPGRNGNHTVLLIFFLIQTDNRQLLNHAGERLFFSILVFQQQTQLVTTVMITANGFVSAMNVAMTREKEVLVEVKCDM